MTSRYVLQVSFPLISWDINRMCYNVCVYCHWLSCFHTILCPQWVLEMHHIDSEMVGTEVAAGAILQLLAM